MWCIGEKTRVINLGVEKRYVAKELGINEKLAEEIHSDIEKSARETVRKLGKDWSESTIGVFVNIYMMMVIEEAKESLKCQEGRNSGKGGRKGDPASMSSKTRERSGGKYCAKA